MRLRIGLISTAGTSQYRYYRYKGMEPRSREPLPARRLRAAAAAAAQSKKSRLHSKTFGGSL
jgi:hypothetical protein